MFRSGIAALAVALLTGLLVSCTKDAKTAKADHIARGDAYAAQQKYREAILEYRGALQGDPAAADVHLKLGDVYLRLEDLASARGQYIRAADLLPDDPEVQVKAGASLQAAGQYEDARTRATNALAKDPRNAKAHILLGNALAGLGDFDVAIDEARTAITLDPGESHNYANLGYLQLAKGGEAEAEAAFKKAVALDPKSADAKLALARFYWSVGRLDLARTVFLDLIAQDEKNLRANRALAILLVAIGRPEQAEQYVKRVAENSPIPGDQFALSDFYVTTKRFGEAIAVLQPMLKGKDQVEATLRLATVDYDQGRQAQAWKSVEDILARQPRNVRALILKGRFLLTDGKLEEALTPLKAAMVIDPNAVLGYMTLGEVYRAQGNKSDAISAYLEVLKRSPRVTQAMLALGDLYLGSGERGAEKAVQYAEQVLRILPSHPGARMLLGRALVLSGDLDRAEKEVKAATTADPNSAQAQIQLGAVSLRRNDLVGAERAFGRAATLDPNSVDALSGLVTVDIARKQMGAARAKIAAQLARTPNNSAVLVLAARLYQYDHDFAEAERALRKVITVDPKAMEAYGLLGQLLISQGRLDQARTELEAMAKADPRSIGTRTALAVVLQLQKKPAEARRRYEEVLLIDSRAPIAANNLAWMYAEEGKDLDLALQLAQTAKTQMPNRSDVIDTVGWVLYKKRLYGPAITQFKECVEKDPRSSACEYHLGLAYSKSGYYTQAIAHLQNALRISSTFDGADDARSVLSNLLKMR